MKICTRKGRWLPDEHLGLPQAARAACRRAERRVTSLRRADGVAQEVPAYLNRLADPLFVAARLANHAAGVSDGIWAVST